MSDALDCLSSSKARFKFLDASISDNGYRNLNLNHVQKCMDVYIQLKSTPPLHKKTSASKNFLGIAVLTKVKDTHLEQNVSKLSLNDRWKNENRRKEFLCNLDDSDKAAEGERWHKKKESSVKKASTLSLHIAAYENAIEASDLNEENDLASTAKTTAKPVSSREGVQRRYANLASGYSCPFEFPRQQQNAESGAPEIMQFSPSQKLLSPNDSSASGSTSAPSTTGTPAASQIDQAFAVGNVPEQKKTGRFNTEIVPMLPAPASTESNLKDNFVFNLDKFADKCKSIVHAGAAEVAQRYENFLEHFPSSIGVVSVNDLTESKCCVACCCYKLSKDRIKRERLKLPTSSETKESMFYVLKNYHYFLILHSLKDDNFEFVIGRDVVCANCFCQVYIICKNRFDSCCTQILKGFKLPPPHGNSGHRPEHVESLKRLGKLVNTIYKLAEPHPNGNGYLMPPSLTKDLIVQRAGYNTDKVINPTREIRKIVPTIHIHASNSLTKCETCIKLKNLMQSDILNAMERKFARQHYNNHLYNIDVDNRTLYIARDDSMNSTDILSVSHDGMSMNHSKYPYCTVNKGKTITDASRMMNPLNIAVVHRKFRDSEDELHAYWNTNRLGPSDCNATITQLFHAISHCEIVSNVISVNLDNCPVNRNYTLLCAFGLLLLWVPSLTKILVCMKEVGHTHNEVDQKFGTIVNAMKRTEVYSPQGYVKLIEETFPNVKTNNVLMPVYDFETIIKPHSDRFGKVRQNHFFEISKDADGEIIVKLARYIRSEQFIMNEKSPSDSFRLFKETPDLDKLPELIPLAPFDVAKHNKLCQDARGTVPIHGVQELIDLPKFLEELPQPQSFEEILNRIRSKVVPPVADLHLSDDLDSQNMKEFMDAMVEKYWPKTDDSLQNASASLPPVSRKTKSPQSEILEAPEIPPPKRGRGRPKKT